MENYKSVDAQILSSTDIKQVKQAPFVPLFILIASVALGYFTIISLGDSSVTYGVVFVCAVLAIVGFKGVIMPKKILKYMPTAEKIKRKELYFNFNQKDDVCKCVQDKSLDALSKLPQGESGRIKVIYYTTPSNKFSLMQVQEYIPYEYVPMTACV